MSSISYGLTFKNIDIDEEVLKVVAEAFSGGYVTKKEPQKLMAYFNDSGFKITGSYEPVINSVIGFYYAVNTQKFPGFVYFVDFYHQSTNSKDAAEHRTNTIIELPIEQTSTNLIINTKLFINPNNIINPIFEYEPSPSERISLEGDFGEFYYVYCGKNSEDRLKALTILEPNLMLNILQNFGNATIYIMQNKLFIVIPKFLEDSQKIIKAIRNAATLTEQINHTIKSINSENRHDIESKAAKAQKSKGYSAITIMVILGLVFL